MKTEQIGLGLSARNRRFRETKPISISQTKEIQAGYFVRFTMKYVERVLQADEIVYWPEIILIVAAIIALHGTDAL